MADDAGALLVRSGLIAAEHLAAARGVCAQVGGTLGEHLVAADLISDEQLTEFYRSRLLVPQVNPNSLARLSPEVVGSVPSDMAVEFRVVPVSVDREGNLTVAMSDPSNRHAVDEIAFFTGKYVVRAVATQMQIAWCLAHYYGHITELGTRLLRPAGSEAAPAPAPAAPQPTRVRGDTGRVDASRHRALAPITRPPLNEARPVSGLLERGSKVPVPARPTARATPPAAATPAAPAPPRAAAPAPAPKPVVRESTPTPPTPVVAVAPPNLPRALSQVAPPPIATAPTAPPPKVPAIPHDATTLRPGEISAGDVARAAAAHEAQAQAAGEPSDDGEEQIIEIADYPSGPVPATPTVPTGPIGRGHQQPNPPELASRAGEILMRDSTSRARVDEPAVVIAVEKLEPSTPVVIVDAQGEASAPTPIDDRGDDEPATGPTLELISRDDEPDEITEEEPAIVHDRVTDPDSAPILLDRPRTISGAPTPPGAIDDRADTEDDPLTPTGETPERDTRDVRAAPAARAERTDVDDLDADSDVVLLSQPKPRAPRKEKRTQLGIGALGAIVPRPAVATDDATSPGISVVLTAPPEIPSEGDRTIRVPFEYAPEQADAGDDTEAVAVGEAAAVQIAAGTPAITSDPVGDGVPRAFVDDDDDDRKTRPVEAIRSARAGRKGEDVDDGWGPPGTTIPPPFLGATHGMDDTSPSVKIPIATGDDESGPLVVRPATGPLADAAAKAADDAATGLHRPAPPRLPAGAGAAARSAAPQAPITSAASNRTIATAVPPVPVQPAPTTPRTASRPPSGPASTLLAAPPRPPTSPSIGGNLPALAPTDLARDLEEAATKLLELLRELEKATERDAVIELLVGHLAMSHARVGFFAVKGGELQPFALRPKPPGPLPTLLLSRASTFQDVVGTRLPYRGPVVDDSTRRLLIAAFASAPDEMLALPVAIKDRVVGIAYGDSRQRHTFDEQLAIAARAAGQALERILKEHKRAV